jgi:hypothetical protein
MIAVLRCDYDRGDVSSYRGIAGYAFGMEVYRSFSDKPEKDLENCIRFFRRHNVRAVLYHHTLEKFLIEKENLENATQDNP